MPAARALGVQLVPVTATTDADIDAALFLAAERRIEALLVSDKPFFTLRHKQIVALAAHHALPAVYGWPGVCRSRWITAAVSRMRDIKSGSTITILGAAAVGIVKPAKAWPQEWGRKYRLGFLVQTPRGAPHFTAVFDELRSYGFIEGANLTVTGEFSVTYDRLEAVAVALAKAYPDAIVCGGVATRVVQRLTTAIPILAIVDDMGPLVDSFAHPGGYTTGVSIFATELDGKRQEILIEFLPVVRHIAALADPANTSSARERALQKTALLHGVGLSIYRGDKPEDITVAIEAAQRAGAQALNVLASPILNANRQLIIERVALARLPAIYQWPEAARDGALLAYGPRFASVYRQLARQVVKVLKGAKPADVPVEQPTKFELVINLKTAKALGLVIPPTLLARTDEVIE